MRRALFVCGFGLVLGACAHRPEVSTHPQLDAQAMDRPEKEGLPGAVESPFEDVNVIRKQIPPVLLWAEQNPYERPKPPNCSHIISEVTDLDDALGDDFDVHETEDPETHKGRVAGETMVAIARDTEDDFIPFRSWVRRLSGADRQANAVRAAVYAGRSRRSYLKGLGEALGCRYPAKPKGAPSAPILQPSRAR